MRNFLGSMIVCAMFLTACSGAAPTGAPAARPGSGGANEAAAEIKLGAVLPLTGPFSASGTYFQQGYQMAIDEANAAGGVDVGGKKLQVSMTLLDDGSNATTSRALVERLVTQEKVNALLGGYDTTLVQAQEVVPDQYKIPMVEGGGAASAIFTRGNKYVFGTLQTIDLLGKITMEFLANEVGQGHLPRPTKIALVWENTAHGKDFRKGVSDFAQKSGGGYQVLVDESFELNGKDFGALLGKVKAASVDLFLVDAHLPDYITMHRQYVAAGMCHKVVTYGARGAEKDAIQALGKENTAYVLSGVWWSPQLAAKPGPSRDFVAAFKAKYGNREPEWFQALGYESARVLFAAIQQAGKIDREAVRAKLAAMKTPSLLPGGTAEFKAEVGQQVQNSFVVQQNQPDGTSPIIFPKDVATGTGIGANPRCAR